MRISSSSISMSAQSRHIESYTKEESLKAWVGNERPDFEGDNAAFSQSLIPQTDILELSDTAKALTAQKSEISQGVQKSEGPAFEISEMDKRKIEMLQEFLQRLTGKKIKFVLPEKISLKDIDSEFLLKAKRVELQPPQKQGWGIEYERHESFYEQEKLSFTAQGKINTSDGREINFSVDLNMSREFASREHISIRAGDAAKIDPLIINFNGNVPSLTEKKYSFDLDTDGKADQISFVNPGSGFLALDLNSDGIINNGRELFGPNTGNGFGELSQYDSDHNNWIDENDSIYEKLRIWAKDENGNDRLFALGQKGVGAIYLGSIDTDFNIKNSANELQGQIRKTGIFLKENGTPGTIQHIDLAI